MNRKLSTPWIVVMVTAWILIVAGGIVGLAKYKSLPGELAPAPKVWSEESKLVRTPGIATLVMLNHPRCPCTRASIAELGELMSQSHDRLTAYILFVRPTGFSDDWTKTDLWGSASRIPGVHVVIDEGGVEAARFEALTSGGHIGDNFGLRRVTSLLSGAEPDRTDSPVFGCPLHEPE